MLTDGNGAFRNTASPAYHTIKWYPSSDRTDEEHLYAFEVVDRLVAGRWTHTDYDHGKPRADLAVSTSAPRKTSHAGQEIYDWPGDYAQPKLRFFVAWTEDQPCIACRTAWPNS